jgi:hypothetical protein
VLVQRWPGAQRLLPEAEVLWTGLRGFGPDARITGLVEKV